MPKYCALALTFKKGELYYPNLVLTNLELTQLIPECHIPDLLDKILIRGEYEFKKHLRC